MKNFTLFLLVLFIYQGSSSQQLYFEIGSTLSSFNYENSQGQPLNNLQSTSKAFYGLGFRQSINPRKTLHVLLGASYNNYGAIGSEDSVDNFFEWDITYVGLTVGLGVQLFHLRDLTFLANVSVSPEILIRGTQTINNRVINLVGEQEFNSTILFFRGGLEMQYPLSRRSSISAIYSYGRTGFLNGGDTQETLNFKAHQFGLRFIINLPNCNCDY